MNTKLEYEIADIFTQLRLLDFTEEEIRELKAMNHSIQYLRSFLQLQYGAQQMRSEDLERECKRH